MEGEDVSSLIAESRVIIANPEPSFDGFWRYDDRFHEAIAHASAKPILAKTIIDLRSKARMCHVKRMPGAKPETATRAELMERFGFKS